MRNMFILAALTPLLLASARPGAYPDVKDGWRHGPEVIAVDSAKGILIGMTRHQVYRQLGEPHFSEGIRSRTWNYIFDLRSRGQSTGAICALQLGYKDGRVARIDWQTESCANLAK